MLDDDFFVRAVRPYCWFAAVLLFLSYAIGLWFTLRTHAAVIWTNEAEEKKPAQHTNSQSAEQRAHHITSEGNSLNNSIHHHTQPSIRDSLLYKRILGQSLKQAGLTPAGEEHDRSRSASNQSTKQDGVAIPHLVPPKSSDGEFVGSFKGSVLPSLTEEENQDLMMQVAEMAATAATVAARDATHNARKSSQGNIATAGGQNKPPISRNDTFRGDDLAGSTIVADAGGHEASGGHDAPNWSKVKSSVILLVATVAYAVIAEVLVNTVDVVLESVDIDEKFLGITLFALVPNTTEFLVSCPIISEGIDTNETRTPFPSP